MGGPIEIFAANRKLSLVFIARWLGTLGTDNPDWLLIYYVQNYGYAHISHIRP